MWSLLKKGATDIQARGWATNWKGDGPKSAPINLPIPEMTGVTGLSVAVTDTLQDDVRAKLTWANDSVIVPKPYIEIEDDRYIRYFLFKIRDIICNTSRKIFYKLQKVQNSVARLIVRKRKRESTKRD